MDGERKQGIQTVIHTLGSHDGTQHRHIELSRLLEGLTTRELAEVLPMACAIIGPHRDTTLATVGAHIQIQLVREHVAAQERMSVAADGLQRAGLVLSAAAGFLGLVGIAVAVMQVWIAVRGH